jgi:hypothetical protein
MSTASDHAEWLSLVESSGPFVSVPVLMRTFPQGLDARNPEQAALLREAYEDWLDRGVTQPAVHRLWVMHVLTELLGYPANLLSEGQTLPPGLEAPQPQYGETIRPDFALKHRDEGHKPCLLIQTYGPDQALEKPVTGKPWKATPGTRMMELLHATDIPVGLITNGEQWMLVNARRGESTGFASWYADLWMQEPTTLRAFHSLLGLRRLMGVAENETLPALLAESSKDQQEVTDQLGTQVRHAVEVLVQAFDRIDADSGRTLLHGVSEKDLYDSALTVMMRLVFLFSAEERGLLLLGDRLYDEHYAVSTLRELLHDRAEQHGEEVLERRSDAWARLLATFRVVHGGVAHEAMRLPAYGGSLFNPDKYPHLEGRAVGTSWKEAAAKPLAINNRVVLHLLEALQILRIKGTAEARRISFRALDIEQIGHVYEGLLDHTAKRAPEVVLGLAGAGNKDAELPLGELEQQFAQGEASFLKYLKKQLGKEPAVLRRLINRPEIMDEGALLTSTGGDREIMKRIVPYAPLLRKDDFDRLMVVLPGSIYVTRGSERRSTGTHYTPRSLTEPVVQYTLEPLVYIGPAEGLPKAEWKLKTAKEILALKVCDMAMGSGAFLVQACRYLSERLVEAWEQLEKAAPGMVVVTPEGELSAGDPTERIVPRDAAERIAVARRYVADRCLYGVDINPMAVEMAKLSLWLITLQKDRPFNFLDHAFKCGDSLLGVSTVKQIENFSLRPGDRQITLATGNMFRYVEEAATKRLALEALPSNDFSQIETKNRLHAEAETVTAKVKAIADFLIGLELLDLGERAYDSARDTTAEKVQVLIQQDATARTGTPAPSSALAHEARAQLHGHRTFHWPLEFPEVTARKGFDAFIGNPPFMGGRQMPTSLGFSYTEPLRRIHSVAGPANLVCYFFRRAFTLASPHSVNGLIATDSISETVDSIAALAYILNHGGALIRAIKSMRWPGSASVTIAVVHFTKSSWSGSCWLNHHVCDVITATLDPADSGSVRHALAQSLEYSQGTNVYGAAFIREPAELNDLLYRNPGLKQYLRRYINGDELNESSSVDGASWVIDFGERDENEIDGCDDILSELKTKVAYERRNQTRQVHESRPWLHWDKRAKFYRKARAQRFIYATSIVSSYYVIHRVETEHLYAHGLELFLSDDLAVFGILQSSLHEHWVRFTSGSLGQTTRYTASKCLETFPFCDPGSTASITNAAEALMACRGESIMQRGAGSNQVYALIHSEGEVSTDIVQLRRCIADLDRVVAAAYGWGDIDLGHAFHETRQGVRFTISEAARREVLSRLMALNHQRYAEEVAAGLHSKKKGKGKKGKSDDNSVEDGAPDLFTE